MYTLYAQHRPAFSPSSQLTPTRAKKEYKAALESGKDPAEVGIALIKDGKPYFKAVEDDYHAGLCATGAPSQINSKRQVLREEEEGRRARQEDVKDGLTGGNGGTPCTRRTNFMKELIVLRCNHVQEKYLGTPLQEAK